jgi:hypothetical protein
LCSFVKYYYQNFENKKENMQGRIAPFRISPESLTIYNASVQSQLEWLRVHNETTMQLKKPDKSKGVFVLIEPRKHPNSEFVLRNFTHFMAPLGWALVIVHGTENKEFMLNLVEGWTTVTMFQLNVSDLPNARAYTNLLCTATFWESIPHENILLFQTDTCLLGSQQFRRFTKYDYVGAPWWNVCPMSGSVFKPGSRPKQFIKDGDALAELFPNIVGNGGLSFRKKSAMIEACQRYRPQWMPDDGTRESLPCDNEDVFFSIALTRLPRRYVAPRNEAVRFSIEEVLPTTIDPSTPIAFGLHRVYSYQPPEVVELLLSSSEIVKAMAEE